LRGASADVLSRLVSAVVAIRREKMS